MTIYKTPVDMLEKAGDWFIQKAQDYACSKMLVLVLLWVVYGALRYFFPEFSVPPIVFIVFIVQTVLIVLVLFCAAGSPRWFIFFFFFYTIEYQLIAGMVFIILYRKIPFKT